MLKEVGELPQITQSVKLRSRVTSPWPYEPRPFNLYHLGKETAAQTHLTGIDINDQTLFRAWSHWVLTTLWGKHCFYYCCRYCYYFFHFTEQEKQRYREAASTPRSHNYLVMVLEFESLMALESTLNYINAQGHYSLLPLETSLGFLGNWKM